MLINVDVVMTDLKLQDLGINIPESDMTFPAVIDSNSIEMITVNAENKNQICIFFKSGNSCIINESYESFLEKIKSVQERKEK